MKLSEFIRILQKKQEIYGDLEMVTTDINDCNVDEFIAEPDIYVANRIYVRNGKDVITETGKFLHITL